MLYKALSRRQRIVLCKYFALVAEFDNDNSYTDVELLYQAEIDHPSKGPFHNFTTTSSNGGNIDTTESDNHMSLNMPPQIPNRIVQMEKCLGKEYDNTDPLLKPYPSVVDRKMHGKTLPII